MNYAEIISLACDAKFAALVVVVGHSFCRTVLLSCTQCSMIGILKWGDSGHGMITRRSFFSYFARAYVVKKRWGVVVFERCHGCIARDKSNTGTGHELNGYFAATAANEPGDSRPCFVTDARRRPSRLGRPCHPTCSGICVHLCLSAVETVRLFCAFCASLRLSKCLQSESFGQAHGLAARATRAATRRLS